MARLRLECWGPCRPCWPLESHLARGGVSTKRWLIGDYALGLLDKTGILIGGYLEEHLEVYKVIYMVHGSQKEGL